MDRFELWLVEQIDDSEKRKKLAFSEGKPVWLAVYDGNHRLLLAVLHAYRKFRDVEKKK